jgi:hypothetical protein
MSSVALVCPRCIGAKAASPKCICGAACVGRFLRDSATAAYSVYAHCRQLRLAASDGLLGNVLVLFLWQCASACLAPIVLACTRCDPSYCY